MQLLDDDDDDDGKGRNILQTSNIFDFIWRRAIVFINNFVDNRSVVENLFLFQNYFHCLCSIISLLASPIFQKRSSRISGFSLNNYRTSVSSLFWLWNLLPADATLVSYNVQPIKFRMNNFPLPCCVVCNT